MARTELVGQDTATGKDREGRKHKRLTMNQSFEVTQYLECQRDRIDGKMLVTEVMAELEDKFPGWPMSESAIRSTLRVRKITPKKPPHAMKGKTLVSPETRKGRPGGDYYAGVRECKGQIARLEGTVELVIETNDALVKQVTDLTAQVQHLQKELGVQAMTTYPNP